MDNDLFLTCETLRLTPSLARGQTVKGTFALKCVHTQGYLIVDARQAAILAEFTTPRTVPEVLEICINNRSCIALRDLYELVLKAYRAGILCSEQAVPLRRPAVRWFVGIKAALVGPIAFAVGVGVIATLAVRVPTEPARALDFVWGWVAVCGALTLAHVLAASVLRAAGCEVYQPRLRWQTGVPHFSLDLRDVCMSGRFDRAMVHAMPLVVLAGAVVASLWLDARWGIVVLAALFLAARPAGGGSVGRLIDLLRRQPLLDIRTRPLFTTGRGLRERARALWRATDFRAAVLQLTWAVVWSCGLGYFAYRFLRLDPALPYRSWVYWEKAGIGVLAALVALVLVGIAGVLQWQVRRGVRHGWRRWRLGWRRWLGKDATDGSVAADALLRRNLLLRLFPGATLTEVATEMQPCSTGPWNTLIRFDDEPSQVGVIVSGRMTVYRRLKSGRKVRFLQLVEGDIFGAHSLVDPEHASLEVRTNTPCRALVMSSEAFKRLVVDRLGAATVCSHVHKLLFLQQTRLCASWRPPAIIRFIELAQNVEHPAGTKIIIEGAEVRSLCVIYAGRARALRGCKQIGKLRPGDVFGEMSLLQCSAATADVETIDDTRCFIVDRLEFIRFMSSNHHVALQVERIASRRLGRPIFPLDRQSFEIR